MAYFFDLHCHMLCGVDDGAKDEEEMHAMLDMAYADGTRALCLTPHYTPYLFGETTEESARVYAELRQYAARKYPDLHLFLGHELGYHGSCLDALNDGRCRSVAESRYVLVDFPENVSFYEICNAMNRLQQAGYRTILAHTERYRCLFTHFAWICEFVENGGIVQVNAASATGQAGTVAKMQWKKLIKRGIAHIVSSDGHNLSTRQPKISVCVKYLKKYCSPEYFRALTWDNACRVVRDETV